jgi:hypothetical protein
VQGYKQQAGLCFIPAKRSTMDLIPVKNLIATISGNLLVVEVDIDMEYSENCTIAIQRGERHFAFAEFVVVEYEIPEDQIMVRWV